MKKITLLLLLLILPTVFVGQNLISDGTFSTQTGDITADTTPWKGFGFGGTKTTAGVTDPLTGGKVGRLGDGNAALRQDFAVTENLTYQVTFDYRWVATSSGITITVRTVTPNAAVVTFVPSTTVDVWHKATITFTAPVGQTSLRLNFYHATGSQFLIDNVSARRLYTFDGSTDTDWDTASNWDANEVPVDDDVIIPTGLDVVLNGGATVGNVTINGTGTLTLNAGSSLVVATGNNVTGNFTYNRTLTANEWHLVSPPVVGATYDDTWITNNGIASGTGNNRGISTYQNGAADPTTGQWVYAQATVGGTFDSSKGYALRRSTTGTISFRGTLPSTSTSPEIAISQGTNNFNLVGNPRPTYYRVSEFFTDNTVTDRFTENTIWVWNPTTDAYEAKTSGGTTFQIAPGQAFFVSAGSAASNKVWFYNYRGTHQTDSFLKSTKTQVNLSIASGTTIAKTELFYIPEGTNDFDNGYDASMFTGVASNFSLYTSQLSDAAKKLAIQTLSDENVETLVVPVGIKAGAGQEITFSAEAMNLPEGIKVFLEDRENNTITRLDEANSTYKVTLAEAIDGNGRFFLHTKTSGVLNTEDVAIENVSIYKTSNATLRVVGLENGTTSNIKMYNVTGKQVLDSNFQSKGAVDIALPRLATGIYIVQLQNENGRINKKIILE